MSEQQPLPGQITEPNPLEIFWEKYRRYIEGLAWLAVLAVAAFYAWRYWQRVQRNRTWNAVFDVTKIRESWEPDLRLGFPIPPDPTAFLDKVDDSDADRRAEDLDGAAEPWIRWVVACKAAKEGDPSRLEQELGALRKSRATSAYFEADPWPPVYVPPPKKELAAPKKGGKREENAPRKPAPVSLVAMLRKQAKANATFRKEHPELFTPPEPDGKESIVFETSAGTFKVKLYPSRAPKHCRNFLDKCKAGFYGGMRFHKIQHEIEGPFPQLSLAGICWLGNPVSKEEDTSKWKGAENYASKETVPHENSGLSHFPFMLAADRKEDRLGSDTDLVYFTASDAAATRDGAYVVFGRVVEGRDVIRRIVEGELSSSAEEQRGIGRPKSPVKVLKVRIES